MAHTLQQWYTSGSSFRFNGHTIFYKEEGTGDALLCLHGFPTASWDWHKVWDDLTARYRVVAADMLGYGHSDKPRSHDYTIMEQADLHAVLLDHLNITSAHVLAHDYGDTVAQELLARHNAGMLNFTMRSLCLLNGGLFPETHRARLIQKLLLTPLGPVLAQLYNRRLFVRSFRPLFGPHTQPTEEELDDFWAVIAYNNGRHAIPRLQRYIPQRRQHRERWVGALVQAAIPVKVINGLEDPVSGGHMVERYRELIPNPDITELPGIGHYPQVEAPQQVLDAYLAFLDSVEGG